MTIATRTVPYRPLRPGSRLAAPPRRAATELEVVGAVEVEAG